MTAGETILKFTDYPFAYSIIGIISGMIGFSLGQNSLIFLGLAGAIGTFLTIVDPLGEMLRKNAVRRIIKKSKMEKLEELELQLKISSLKSKSITYEMEKIIGMFYFVIIIILFLIAVVTPTPFFDKLIILDNDKVPLCDEWCFKFSYLGLGLFALVIISEKGRRFWKELDNKINIAANHMSMINDDNATQTSVASMTRAVEQNDWELASLWSHKIEDEILNKKGKRELIIKSAEQIYIPLHLEGKKIQKILDESIPQKNYNQLPIDTWIKIKNESLHVMIEDSDERIIIDEYYDKIHEYNASIFPAYDKVKEIILTRASETFVRKITKLDFFVRYPPNNETSISLDSCAMFNIDPLTAYDDMESFYLRGDDDSSGKLQHFVITEHQELNLFLEIWSNIKKDIASDQTINKMKNLFEELKVETKQLLEEYSKKIEMQRRV